MKLYTAPKIKFGTERDCSNFLICKIDCTGFSKKISDRTLSVWQYQYILLYEGTAQIYHDQERVLVSSNQLILSKACQQTKIALSTDARGYALTFTASFLEQIDRNDGTSGENNFRFLDFENIPVYTPLTEDVKIFAELLLKEFISQNSYKGELLQRYFRIFIIHILKQLNAPQTIYKRSKTQEIVNNFKSLLEDNFKIKKMVADYADALAVTPNYLNAVIKKSTGFSAGYHIRQRIALEAKWQATYSNNGMKGIAYDLGFDDLAHFSKFFKNTTGMSFSQYKNNERVLQPVA